MLRDLTLNDYDMNCSKKQSYGSEAMSSWNVCSWKCNEHFLVLVIHMKGIEVKIVA